MNSTEKLIAYCLGGLPVDERTGLEESLSASPALLSEFISIKRALESEFIFQGEPSINLRIKLRSEIQREFSPREPSVFSWCTSRPIKPAFALAAAFLLVLASGMVFMRKNPPIPGETKSGISVDAANPTPLNFNFL